MAFTRVNLALAMSAALALTACGGGGGSSSPPKIAAPQLTTNPNAIPVSWQSPGTTVTYAVDSSSVAIATSGLSAPNISSAGNASGVGQVTITTDASGNLSTVAFNIPTPTTPFVQTYTAANLQSLPSFSLSVLANAISAILNTPNSSGFIALGPKTVGLNYSAYGLWAQNSGGSGLFGAVGIGSQTPAASMPQTGTATYNGQTVGAAALNDGSGSAALAGNIQLTANFAAKTVSTNISGVQVQDLSTAAVTAIPTNFAGNATIVNNHYTGSLSGGQLSGTSTGTFYGPAAQETAGTWQMTGGGMTAIGSYGAKR